MIMKKLLLKKLLAAFTLLGMMSPTWADNITKIGTAINDLSTLKGGTKVMFYHQHASDGTDRHYYLYDNNGTIGSDQTAPEAGPEAKYAWTVITITENGQTLYKFRSNETGKYINFVNGENAKTLKDTGSKFSIQRADDNIEDHWKIKDTETTNSYSWFNGDPISIGGFTTYSGGSPYEIIPVETNTIENPVTITKTDQKGNTESVVNDVRGTGDYSLSQFISTEEDYTIFDIQVNGVPVSDINASVTISGETKINYKVIYTPFESSNIQGSEFPNETKWYLLGISDNSNNKTAKYLHYVDPQSPIELKENADYSDGYWWAFNITENGTIEIFNKAAGADKKLSSKTPIGDNATGGNTYPKMLTSIEITDEYTSAWDINPSTLISNKKGFFLDRAGEEDKCLNDRDAKLAFWTEDKDLGSVLWAISLTDLAESLKDNVIKFENVVEVGYESSFVREIENMEVTPDTYIAFKEKIDNATHPSFDSNKYYRIWGAKEPEYIYINENDKKFYTQQNKSGIDQIFKFENTNEEGVYNLKVQGKKIAKTTSNSNLNLLFTIADNDENNGTFQLVTANTGTGIYRIQNMNGDASPTYVWKEYQKVVGWSGTGNGSQWYLVEAPSIDITISVAGYSTANYPFAVTLPEGIKAYTGTIITEDGSNKVFLLNEVPEGKIPAETPVVLAGEANQTYTLTIDSENTNDPITSNDLAGTLLPETIEEGTTIYGLSQYEGVVGFYKLADNATNRTVSANKAYLPGTPAIQGVRGLAFSFNDNDGTTTGIENIVTETGKEEYYDLQGRRVMNPSHGIYITKSGKKVFFAK